MKQSRTALPPTRVSDEATARGLELAHAEGDAFGNALHHMIDEVAKGGAEQRAGDYLVGYAYEDPEGLYHWRDGSLEWREPGDANVHLEITVRDAADGRFVFGVGVRVDVLATNGDVVGSHDVPFLWHPSLLHYGANIRLPGDGTYTLRVHIDPPAYSRHDRVNGRRFIEPVETEFRDVEIDTRNAA